MKEPFRHKVGSAIAFCIALPAVLIKMLWLPTLLMIAWLWWIGDMQRQQEIEQQKEAPAQADDAGISGEDGDE